MKSKTNGVTPSLDRAHQFFSRVLGFVRFFSQGTFSRIEQSDGYRKKLRGARFSAGFTLIELLLVLAITAILAVMGTVSLFGLRSQNAVRGEASKIDILLKNAQQNSISQVNRGEWGVQFKNDPPPNNKDWFELFSYDGTYTPVKKVYLESGQEFGTDSGCVYFNRITGTPNLSQTVLGCDAFLSLIKVQSKSTTQSLTITISANGLISQ